MPTVRTLFIAAGIFFAHVTWADQYYGFVRVACIEELAVLEIDSVTVHASNEAQAFLEKEPGSKLDERNLGVLQRRYGLHVEGPILASCKLGERLFSMRLQFTQPSERGMCGAGTRGFLHINVDGKPLLENIRFAEACFGVGVVRLSLDGDSVNWDFHLDKGELLQGTVIYNNRISFDLASGTYWDVKGKRVRLPITMREISEYPVPANRALQPTR